MAQVREPNLKVFEDGTASNFTIYSTVPIYCHDDTPDRDCVLGVSLLAFGAGKLSACLQTAPLDNDNKIQSLIQNHVRHERSETA